METIMPSAEKVSDMAEYNIVKITSDDTEFVYKLYCQNNSFIDEYISDKPILDANRHYGFTEFVDILDDDNTYSLICTKKKELKGPELVFLDEKVGFLCYEKGEKCIRIVFIEAKNNVIEIYDKLLEGLIKKLGPATNYKLISIDVEEIKDKIMESLCKNKFIESKMITPQNGPDIFTFERKL